MNMNKLKNILTAIILLVFLTGIAQAELQNMGYVVVSPQGPIDGGDFGPYTPGTKTSGIQEAFDYAWVRNELEEVYIVGGPDVVYTLDETLDIPWGQNWHCDGGNYVMNFTITNGDCMVIDSQMNSILKFGSISAPNLQSGSIVKIYPHTDGPDNFTVCVSAKIEIGSITGPGSGSSCVGLETTGPTIYSFFSAGEISGSGTGIEFNSGTNIKVTSPLIRNCGTMLRVNSGSDNIFRVSMDATGVSNPLGLVINSGGSSTYHLNWKAGFNSTNALSLGSGSGDNLIYAMNLPGYDGVTANSSDHTKIITTDPVGFDITTPTISSSGTFYRNQTSFPIMAMITNSGSTTSYRIVSTDGSQTISGTPFAGQIIYLAPGDGMNFYFSGSAPVWVWKALR